MIGLFKFQRETELEKGLETKGCVPGTVVKVGQVKIR